MMDITIEALRLASYRRLENGSKLVARFDVEIGPLFIRGCILICTGRGFFLVKGPKGTVQASRLRAVTFRDKELRERVRDTLLPAYYALGGKEALNIFEE